MTKNSQKFYEGASSAGKSTSMTYAYDSLGNVVSYMDFGDDGDEDDISASIIYHSLPDLYVVGTPTEGA